jgi:hypothetical protein
MIGIILLEICLLFFASVFIAIVYSAILCPKYSRDLYNFSLHMQDVYENKVEHLNTDLKNDYKLVLLKDHNDFAVFSCCDYFKTFIRNIENIPIPSQANYGMCAILVYNFERFKNDVNHESFLVDACNVLGTLGSRTKDDVYKLVKKIQKEMKNVSTIKDFSYRGFYGLLYLFNEYCFYILWKNIYNWQNDIPASF